MAACGAWQAWQGGRVGRGKGGSAVLPRQAGNDTPHGTLQDVGVSRRVSGRLSGEGSVCVSVSLFGCCETSELPRNLGFVVPLATVCYGFCVL